jgi:hypothetical protein
MFALLKKTKFIIHLIYLAIHNKNETIRRKLYRAFICVKSIKNSIQAE